MAEYYITYNDYFGFCVIEKINGTGRIVFAGSIEDCNQKCIKLNSQQQAKRSDLERQPRTGRRGSDDGRPHKESEVFNMEKYIVVATDEQIERSKARRKVIESLEYNPMCYNCKSFGKSCKGSTNKVYSGCIYKEVDESKPSIYEQIAEKVKQSKPPRGGLQELPHLHR